MSEFTQMVDNWLLDQHNKIAKEFFTAGREAERQYIFGLLKDQKWHTVVFETITLVAGQEPKIVQKHSETCGMCYALKLLDYKISGESKDAS